MAQQFNPATGKWEEIGGSTNTANLTNLEQQTVNTAKKQEEDKKTSQYDSYYNQYTQLTSKYGLTPVDRASFDAAMQKGGDAQGQFIAAFLLPTYDNVKNVINTKLGEYSELTGTPYSSVSQDYIATHGDWRGKSADEVISNINNDLSGIFTDVNKNIDLYKKKEKEPKKDDPLVLIKDKINKAVTGGIITQEEADKYIKLADAGQISAIETELQKATTNFLRGDIETGAPDLSKMEVPTFTPETVQTWYDTLDKMEAPLQEQQLKKVSEYYNSVNPLTTGSGAQIKATDEMLARNISDRYGRAMGIGQQEYEKKYNLALQDFENRYTDYWKRLNRDWGVSDVNQARTQYETDIAKKRQNALSDYATQYTNATNESYRNRNWANQDWAKSENLAEKMARMSNKPIKGQDAAARATAGATIGTSILPGWGTAIGGIGGYLSAYL